MAELRALPENSVEEINEKRRRFDVATSDPNRWSWRIAADLYVAAFLTPKTGGVPQSREAVTIPTSAHIWQALSGRQVYGPLIGRAQDVTGEARAFHWPLEFADVMGRGGFDVVLGNPPWERIKLQEQEFFAAREPEIASAPNAAARGKMIAALAKAETGTRERNLHEEFERAKRDAEAISVFVRVSGEEAGRFPLTGRGDVNTYALFAELFSALASPRGRAGVIVPTGIATDATTQHFFGDLVSARRLVTLFSFFEIRLIFPATDDRNSFCLLTMGQTQQDAEFALSLRNVADLSDERRRYHLSAGDIIRPNPNTKTAPVFRARADTELTAKIYSRVPVLIEEGKGAAGNPWGVSFMAMFHMSNDSGLFRTAAELEQAGFLRASTDWVSADAPERYVQLYEAKMIHQFDHRWATYDGTDSRDVTLTEKQDSAFEPVPRYWVPERDVTDRLAAKGWTRGWCATWRRNARNTDERTMIAEPLTSQVGVGDSLFLLNVAHTSALFAALLGNMNSVSLDFLARQKVSGVNMSFYFINQFPVFPPSFYTPADLSFIVPRVLELTYTSHAMRPFAQDLGFSGLPFAWNEERRALLRAELDAFYARAYGLTRDELRYILDPVDVKGADYPSETFRVLKSNEIRRLGEYRTARLVLQAWDAMEERGMAAAE